MKSLQYLTCVDEPAAGRSLAPHPQLALCTFVVGSLHHRLLRVAPRPASHSEEPRQHSRADCLSVQAQDGCAFPQAELTAALLLERMPERSSLPARADGAAESSAAKDEARADRPRTSNSRTQDSAAVCLSRPRERQSPPLPEPPQADSRAVRERSRSCVPP